MYIDRIKRVVRLEGYGFWLAPDGLFPFFGAIIATGVLTVAAGVPETIRKLSDLTPGVLSAGTLFNAAVYLAMIIGLSVAAWALAPVDFEAILRFHAWIAAVGSLLTLGIVALASWPLPGWVEPGHVRAAVRLVAILGLVLAGGLPLRHVLGRRWCWVRDKTEELRRGRG